MELQGPSPYPQVPATCPYPGPTPFSPYDPSNFLKIYLNIILPSKMIYGCVILPLETLSPHPGDSSGGVVYLRIVLSPEDASQLMGNS
jgi:hypothetical protein